MEYMEHVTFIMDQILLLLPKIEQNYADTTKENRKWAR